MIKRLFDWTPRDFAYWEKFRQRGLGCFIAWYGVLLSGGVMFVLFCVVVGFTWVRQSIQAGMRGEGWLTLFLQLAIFAALSVSVGILNSLITWVVEERLYRKYKRRYG
jgi:hypothetical protein